MKRMFSILFLLFVIIIPLQVRALNVSKNNLTIEKGKSETIDLYAQVEEEVTEISFSLVYTSYDVPANFNVASGLKDSVNGIKHRISFSVPVTGKVKLGTIKIDVVNNPKITVGAINVHTASAKNSNNDTINLNAQTINVNINKINEKVEEKVEEPKEDVVATDKETEEIVNKHLLSKIESEIVNIELKENVFEYTVKVKDDISELDLKPVLVDDKYTIEVSSQKISELTDNKIVIMVKDGDKTQEYKIKVNVIPDVEIEIDESETETTYSYKGKWVLLIVIMSVALTIGLFLNKRK